jgi:transcriptional antiterminator NusG
MTDPVFDSPQAGKTHWRRRQAERRGIHSLGGIWHVVRAIGRSDREVNASLVNLGFAVYSPRVLEMRPLGKRQMSARQRRAGIEISRPELVPLFPRYLFVRFDMGRSAWRDIFGVVGVAGLVCDGGLPVPVTQAVIDRIRDLETGGTILAREQKMRVVFAVGQQVRINSGPFADFRAVMQTALDQPFDQVDPETRVRVMLSLFGGAQPVELDVWQVEAV